MPDDPIASDYDKNLLPAYAQVAYKLQAMLAQMKAGERLPTERELCENYGVSRVTLRRAMDPLRQKGIVKTSRGGGTQLCREVTAPSPSRSANKLIGVIVPSVENPFISRIVKGAEALASERLYHLALAHNHDDDDYQLQQLTRMADSSISGIAVFPEGANINRPEFYDVIKRIKAKGIPLVMIDRYLPHIDVPCVLSDNVAGAYLATEHLILSGHRRLALLSFGPDGGISERERLKGFYDALNHYGLPTTPVHHATLGVKDHEEKARLAVKKWLSSDQQTGTPGFDGIFCLQDNMAYGAYLALREASLNVPQNVSLVGYDNVDREIIRASGLHLTSIDQRSEDIGWQSARLLIDQIEGHSDDSQSRHILLKPKLVVRNS
jgi:DNA-binding LacI/PurR family transcriptional regulator